MKLYCDGLDLSASVLKVIKATSNRNVNPILEGIKLVAKDDNLILMATDGELAIIKTINADVKVDGETVVPGKFFCEFVKKLTDDKIELELNEKNQLKIRYTDSETFIQCLNPNEYPNIQNVENSQAFSIATKEFKSLIEKTIFSVATDDTRPILKGALFELRGNKITAVALDGYRLAKATKNLEKENKDIDIVIPGRSLKEINNLLDDTDDILSVFYDKNYIMVEVENTKIISRILEGQFINYRAIIPQNFTTMALVNKNLLENSLEQGAILARVSNDNSVKFNLSEKVLNLKTNSELGNWTDNIAINLTGNDLAINFNSNYIKDCLRVIDDEFVTMCFSSKISPCIIKPTDEDVLYLILPLRQI